MVNPVCRTCSEKVPKPVVSAPKTVTASAGKKKRPGVRAVSLFLENLWGRTQSSLSQSRSFAFFPQFSRKRVNARSGNQTTCPLDNSPQTTHPRSSDNSPPIFGQLAPNTKKKPWIQLCIKTKLSFWQINCHARLLESYCLMKVTVLTTKKVLMKYCFPCLSLLLHIKSHV